MRRWISLALAGSLLCAAPLAMHLGHAPPVAPGATETQEESDALAVAQGDAGYTKDVTPAPLTEVDLTRAKADDTGYVAPAHGSRVARLTLDPALQKTADRLLRAYGVPEAAIVMTDTSGRVLVWASHSDKDPGRDLCVEAKAPAASVFKIVTASALVEQAGLSAATTQCYWGGEQRIDQVNLVDDPRRDKWCSTLGDAMGRSLNAVFARLASKNLDRSKLEATARALGFGEPPAFDVPVEPNTLSIPDDALGFARTSAGFWNSTLSPLGAVSLALTFANGGIPVRPYVVDRVSDGKTLLYRAPTRQTGPRAVKAETADAVTHMLETTVANGTSFRAFHDRAGKAFLPDISVAGKTGTLTRAEADQYYTWFVGFAPSRTPEVSIAVLAVNGATWRVKANVISREMLRAYFARKGAPGVTTPRYASEAHGTTRAAR